MITNKKFKKYIQELGREGGKKSAQIRFKGKTKKQISEIMSKVRLTPKEEKEVDEMMGESVQSIKNTIKDKKTKINLKKVS